jgi:hypothetical protein
MFDQILQLVKEHLGENPQVQSAIPPDQADAIHNEIATHLNNNVSNHPTEEGGGLLSKLENSMASGGTLTSAVEGGLVSSLTSKFGLSPAITGAIAGMLPGLLQKFAQKKMNTDGTA